LVSANRRQEVRTPHPEPQARNQRRTRHTEPNQEGEHEPRSENLEQRTTQLSDALKSATDNCMYRSPFQLSCSSEKARSIAARCSAAKLSRSEARHAIPRRTRPS